MQIIVSPEDIQQAPDAVQAWLNDQLFGGQQSVSAAHQARPIEGKPTKVEAAPDPPIPSADELLETAVSLIESKGEDTLAKVLEKVGVRRVKECPEDKRAELLAEIAIHA